MGKYGLTIDNLLSVEIVTADGELRYASAAENGDLFSAVRGGGNFAIVTAFGYRLHPVAQVLAGIVVYPIERAEEVLRFYRELSQTAPDELIVYAAIVSAPDGMPIIAIAACYDGPIEQGERLIAPLRAFWAETKPFANEAVYVNFMTDDGDARLRAIKNKYDPENFFRLNQNIKPMV